jgi:hypothetical protein
MLLLPGGMKRIVLLSALSLSLLGGVASADRHRGGNWNRGGDRGSHHEGRWSSRGGASWSGGVRVHSAPSRWTAPRRVYVQRARVVRRPIYVQRPVIDVRYYDYYSRPAVVREDYAPVAGYVWVAGAWSWSGYEWTWTAGHYEPDPNNVVYYDGYYDY